MVQCRDFHWQEYARLFDQFTFDHQRELLRDGLRFSKGKLIDLGCGSGKGFEYLSNEVTDLLGVDSSSNMLSYAKSAKTPSLNSKRFLETEIESFDVANETPDSICLFNSLYGCENPVKVLSNTISGLSRGGTLIVGNQGRSINLQNLLDVMKEQVSLDQEEDYERFLDMNHRLMGIAKYTPRTYELCELESLFELMGADVIYSNSEHFYGSCPLIVGRKK